MGATEWVRPILQRHLCALGHLSVRSLAQVLGGASCVLARGRDVQEQIGSLPAELAASVVCGSRMSTAHRCAPCSSRHTPTLLTLTVPLSLPKILPLSLPSTVSLLWFSYLGGFRLSSGEAQGTGALNFSSVPLFFSPNLKRGTTENSRPSKKLPDPRHSIARDEPWVVWVVKTVHRWDTASRREHPPPCSGQKRSWSAPCYKLSHTQDTYSTTGARSQALPFIL